MTIDLTVREWEMVERWYNSAAGESCTCDGGAESCVELLAVLKKFGFELHYQDEYECKRHGIEVTVLEAGK